MTPPNTTSFESAPSARSAATVSMKGGGYYSEHTQGAKDVIDNTTSIALDALAQMTIEESADAFSIADFGCADGGTSVDLIGELINGVRQQAPSRAIVVHYTDLPGNDFSSVFNMVHGGRPDVQSYLPQHQNVFVLASGTSFYRQIFPAASLDFGFSATAMHWLSEVPGILSHHVHAAGATGSEFETFRACALRNWETILSHRAQELKPGARLVMSNFCRDEQGHYLGNTGGVNMHDTFNELWHALVDQGVITQAEYTRTAFPQFYKTLEEFCEPLVNPHSPVYRAGLRLESAQVRTVHCPYRAAFENHGDVDRFANAYVPTLRSWSEVVFYNALDASRPVEQRRAIVEQFYQSYVDRVRAAPNGHAMDYVHVYMTVSKPATGTGE